MRRTGFHPRTKRGVLMQKRSSRMLIGVKPETYDRLVLLRNELALIKKDSATFSEAIELLLELHDEAMECNVAPLPS